MTSEELSVLPPDSELQVALKLSVLLTLFILEVRPRSQSFEVGIVAERPIPLSAGTLDEDPALDQRFHCLCRSGFSRIQKLRDAGDRHNGVLGQLLEQADRRERARSCGEHAPSIRVHEGEEIPPCTDSFFGDGVDPVQEESNPRFPVSIGPNAIQQFVILAAVALEKETQVEEWSR